jgi:hypothetical protein
MVERNAWKERTSRLSLVHQIFRAIKEVWRRRVVLELEVGGIKIVEKGKGPSMMKADLVAFYDCRPHY